MDYVYSNCHVLSADTLLSHRHSSTAAVTKLLSNVLKISKLTGQVLNNVMMVIFFPVNQLQPSDIKIIAAMGDAFTVSYMSRLFLQLYDSETMCESRYIILWGQS